MSFSVEPCPYAVLTGLCGTALLPGAVYDDVVEQRNPPYAGYTWSEGFDSRNYRSPVRSVEHALVLVAVSLSPEGSLAAQLAFLVDRALHCPDDVRADYPGWLDAPSRSRFEFARRAILEGLAGGMWGTDSYLKWFDWRESPADIEEQLRPTLTRPLMSWDPAAVSVEGPVQHPSDTDAYLRENARQSREAGMALIRITKGDSYALCFVPLVRAELLLADAVVAGFTHENDCGLEIVNP